MTTEPPTMAAGNRRGQDPPAGRRSFGTCSGRCGREPNAWRDPFRPKSPAVGEHFVVNGFVVKPGRKRIFTRAELFAVKGGEEKLVAIGEAILVPTGGD